MEQGPRPVFLRYGLAVILSVAALAITILMQGWLAHAMFAIFYFAVILSAWYGGVGPSLVPILVGGLAGIVLLVTPDGLQLSDVISTTAYLVVSLFTGLMTAARERSAALAREQRQELQVTLSSIGDAVIVTDRSGKVTFMNPVAQNLTGWSEEEANAATIDRVFNIVNESTHAPVENPVERIVQSGTSIGLGNHTLLISRGGQEIPIDDSAAPIVNAEGKTTGAVLIFRNIAERRKADQALRESEQRFRALIENSGDAIALLDADGMIRYASASTTRVLGYAPDELLGRDSVTLLHPDDRPAIESAFQDIVSQPGASPVGQFRYQHKDGCYRWVEAVATNLLREPAVRGVVVNFRDITERKQAVEALRESRDQLQVILKGVSEGITLQDRTGQVIYANEAAARLIGFDTVDELLEAPPGEIVKRFEMRKESGEPFPPEQLPGRAVLRGESATPVLVRFRIRATGEERWALLDATSVPDEQGQVRFAINIFRDLTERKRAEQRLNMQYTISRILADADTLKEAAPPVVRAIVENLEVDAGGLWMRRGEQERLHYIGGWHVADLPLEELDSIDARTTFVRGVGLPGSVWTTGAPLWYEHFSQMSFLRSSLSAHAGLQTAFGVPIMLGQETLGVLEFFSRVQKGEDPETLALVETVGGHIAQFIERKRAEDELRASEERMRAIAETASDGIITIDSESRILFMNQAICEIFGYERDDLMGKPLTLLMPRPQRERHYGTIKRYIHTHERRLNWDQIHMSGVRKDGTSVPLEISLGEFLKDGRHYFTGVVRDVTERQATEEQLRASEKRFRSLSANSPIGIFLADMNGNLTYANPPLLAMVAGQDVSDVQSAWEQAIAPEDARTVQDGWMAYIHEGAPLSMDYRIMREGETRWVHVRSSPMFSDEGHLLGHVGTMEDITERKQATETLQFLAEASGVLASSLDYEYTLRNLARLAVPRLADWCVIDILNAQGTLDALEIVHTDQVKAEWSWELRKRFPIDMNAPAGAPHVVRTGLSEMYPDIPDEMLQAVAHDVQELELLRKVGYRSLMVVPLTARGRTFGAITFVYAESNRHYGPADLSLAEELARRAALAVDNASLYAAEQGARQTADRAFDRTLRLQKLTAALSSALTADQVAAIVIEQGLAALGANAGLMLQLSEDGQHVEVLKAVGYPSEMTNAWHDLTIDNPLLLLDAMRIREPIWIGSPDEMQQRYSASPYGRYAVPFRSHAVVPFISEDRVLGGLGISFAEEHPFSKEERDFILTMTGQAALALERARLFRAEQLAHVQALESRERIALLSEASQRLAGSLDFDKTLHLLAELAVPAIADWCTIDIVDQDGAIHMAARAHTDRDKEPLIDELRERFPLPVDSTFGYPRVIRIGVVDFIPTPTPSDLDLIYGGEEQRELIRRIGFSSCICVPLAARGRTLGSITLNRARPGVCYSQDDLSLAEEFARRGAVALDNARLYQETQSAVAVRDQFLSIASHELKTPLTSLLGYAELLRRNTQGSDKLAPRDERAVQVIASQATRLNKLINSMLDVGRIQNKRFRIDRAPFDIAALTRRVVDHARLMTDRHTIAYRGPMDPLILEGDETRLEQVLENLIQNGMKYSPQGGPVHVELECENDEVCIHVTDQGIGIPESELPRLFNRFYRVQTSMTQHISGMGVGLFVVKEIVNAHGGRLSVDSREGFGSTFTVCLPLNADRAIEQEQTPGNGRSG